MRATSLFAPLALLLAACPRGGDASPTSNGAAVTATGADALRALADACRTGNHDRVLAHLADQGLGGGEKFTRAMRASDPMASGIVEDVCEPMPAELVVLASIETQEAGREWTEVTIQVDGESVVYRFVRVGGAWLLGEVE